MKRREMAFDLFLINEQNPVLLRSRTAVHKSHTTADVMKYKSRLQKFINHIAFADGTFMFSLRLQ